MTKEKKSSDAIMLPGVYKELSLNKGSAEPIKQLLREIQTHSDIAKQEIHLGANKKDSLVNLRHAVDLGYGGKSCAIDLLRDLEEVGHQSIYLFKPRNKAIRDKVSNGYEIANLLFDDAWGPDYFPVYDRTKTKLEWADVRVPLDHRPNDWLLKAYGHEIHEETTDRDRKKIGKNKFRETRDVLATDINTVMIARWRSPDWLEIRIDKYKASKTGTEERLSQFKKMLLPAIDINREMVAYSLRPAIANMVKNRNNHKPSAVPVYQVGTVNVLDAISGSVNFRPLNADECIDDDKGRSKTLGVLLENGGLPKGMGVNWLNTLSSPSKMPESLLTHIQGESTNMLSIQKRVHPEVLEYVFNQIKSHS